MKNIKRTTKYSASIKLWFAAVTALILFSACNEGLSPQEAESKTAITGTIVYKNGKTNWPPSDSAKEVRVVCFKKYPPEDVIQTILNGEAFFTADALPVMVDSSSYSIEFTVTPLTLPYIVAALRTGNNFMADWKVIGVYNTSGDQTKPDTIQVLKGKTYKAVNIEVDFNELPPQPF